ncbi:hypothetical protein D7Y13_35440 [Corallococcus praedator]|uniref:DUF2188 domain-containing protein n=2 Tax=Myxococcaceae TaxID=31 RepID=A0ABX9Q6Y4_9BACT|nr:hypothetical protein D7X74_37250 [Corallococcus sp. CA047B]RKH22632.1 hypothetical protein D7X75_35130 [Corallococcus sp. CA031C]RKH92780.1 hypothetical protein D7Y13_35440 [Corallococcus praedator]
MGAGTTVKVMCDRKGWRVDVTPSEGDLRRYRYASEAQARYFAAVFALGPSVLPPKDHARRRQGARLPLPMRPGFGEAAMHE